MIFATDVRLLDSHREAPLSAHSTLHFSPPWVCCLVALLARLLHLSILVKSSPDAGNSSPVMIATSVHSCVVKAGSRAAPPAVPGRLQLAKRRQRSIAHCQVALLS